MCTSADKEARTPRSRGRSVVVLCNCVGTHQSLNKDTPVSHPVQRIGVISSRGILGGLHHQYGCVRKSLILPAGEIPAPERGTSRPTGNRALGSWRQRHELSVGTSDERAVTQVKRLSLVMIVTRRPTASYWLEGNSRSPQEAMVTGDCGGVREHGTFGNGSIEEPERSTVVSARSGNERSMLDEWNIPEKGKRCSGSRIRW
jgi:hypothetical protein